MKIDKNRFINPIGDNYLIKQDKKNISPKLNKVELSANEALSFQGIALIGIFGKSNKPTLLTNLTNREYEELKRRVDEKIKNSSTEIQDCAKSWDINKNNIQFVDKVFSDEELNKKPYFVKSVGTILEKIEDKKYAKLLNSLFESEKIYHNPNILHYMEYFFMNESSNADIDAKTKIIEKILSDEKLYDNESIMKIIGSILNNADEDNAKPKIKIMGMLLSNKTLDNNESIKKQAGDIIANIEDQMQVNIANVIFSNEDLLNCIIDENVLISTLQNIYTKEQEEVANLILSDERLYKNKEILKNIEAILLNVEDKDSVHSIKRLIKECTLHDKFSRNNHIVQYAAQILRHGNDKEKADNFIESINQDDGFPINEKIALFVLDSENLKKEDLEKLNIKIGLDSASKLSISDMRSAIDFLDIYNIRNTNEISNQAKRSLVRKLVSANTELFNLSDEMKKKFPILPKNQEEYCELLSFLAQSIKIHEDILSETKIKQFNTDLEALSNSLSRLSDKEFNSLNIEQTYDKEAFMKDVLNEIKGLAKEEKQKLYDYFGFEIYPNKNTKNGYSILGYPKDTSNKDKLNEIKNDETKKAIEKVKILINKFNNIEGNRITCSDKNIENELNKIIDVLPELRTTIGKLQAGNPDKNGNGLDDGVHSFDVFKHSLKVMQKISQDGNFSKLNNSDKKIMLLASILHDITKKEGYRDSAHPIEGSFDAFFISKKFNLNQEEQIKLYNLIKHHEWLGYINRSKSKEELDKKLKDTAYDMRHDNMLDMSLIFTHADLRAVKNNNTFHDSKYGKHRKDFNGAIRSFGESADYYANKMRNLIEELKKTQPILPVTKIPSASTINRAIEYVKEDGSTNISGVYKDKNGLIVIKYNELENEDLEKIGFPKDSLVSGIKLTTEKGETINTGNVKVLIHGVDYLNQLAKFDIFSLVDSDALLSVSYGECLESKYKFYKPQGVILNCDTKYIHGGGVSDFGSGCKKNIQDFKDNCIFGGDKEEEERSHISKIIKGAIGMSDDEYVNFVKENENKSLSEIKPKELSEKITKVFADIQSKEILGKREYNEFFISNPKPPMAVFACDEYEKEEGLGKPIEFLHQEPVEKRTDFLQKYALEHDIPFFVFGS